MALPNNPPATTPMRVEFGYDFMGRRVWKKAYATTTGGTPITGQDYKDVYDGWNLVAVLNGANNTVIRSFLWGKDVSGTMQGAGGVGGLLAVTEGTTPHFVATDGNGNVVGTLNAAGTSATAQYEYGPFGEVMRASGSMAKNNPFRFSTKFTDDETDLVYYGYRYYSPTIGRWINRDPIEERGGIGIYGFLGNNSVERIDLLGQKWMILRNGGHRAIAFKTNPYDSVKELAKMVHLDESDSYIWLKPESDRVPCQKFSIPNRIHIDVGIWSFLDLILTSGFAQQENMVPFLHDAFRDEGYHVVTSWNVRASAIIDHMADKNLYGYFFLGHGERGGIINTGGLGSQHWVNPGRRTMHGIAFMHLYACYSGDPNMGLTPGPDPDAVSSLLWRMNVARNGRFYGSPDLLWPWEIQAGQGMNYKPGTNSR